MSNCFTYLKSGQYGYITQVIGLGQEQAVRCKTQFDSQIAKAEERIVLYKLERLLFSRDQGDKHKHFLSPGRRNDLDALLRFTLEVKRNNAPGGIVRMIHAHQKKLLAICPLKRTNFNTQIQSMIDWAQQRHKFN